MIQDYTIDNSVYRQLDNQLNKRTPFYSRKSLIEIYDSYLNRIVDIDTSEDDNDDENSDELENEEFIPESDESIDPDTNNDDE